MYNPIAKFRDFLTLREAVRQASNEHAKTLRRYYVIPSKKGKLLIVDRNNFRELKRKHYISDRFNVKDLEAACFYFTPYRNGDGAITPQIENIKRQLFFDYCKDIRKKRHSKPNIFRKIIAYIKDLFKKK